jgi:hypothetical protein
MFPSWHSSQNLANLSLSLCIWWYILQNYNYKLHFQNLSTYHIPHVSIGTLAAENLDVCTACNPWDNNIQLTMVKDQRPGPSMPFLDSNTCAEGGVIYFCQGFLPCMMPSMDGWWDGWMDEKSFTTTKSFTMCNGNWKLWVDLLIALNFLWKHPKVNFNTLTQILDHE